MAAPFEAQVDLYDDDSDDDEPPTLVELVDNEEKAPDNNVVEEQQAELPPCPVTILSGFLGAGKTTLIQYILQSPHHGKRIAVIENEFGPGLNVESMIARDGSNNESLTDLIELPNGCICCTVKDSLIATLENLLERRQELDYILIECSGMANPGPIASLFWLDDALESRLRLDGIVTLADAAHIMEQLATTVEAAQQIAYAERILLNKIDLLDNNDPTAQQERIVQCLRQIHPTAPIRTTTYSAIPDLDWILDTECLDIDRVKEVEQALKNEISSSSNDDNEHQHNHSHDHDDDVCSVCQPPASHQHTAAISTVAFDIKGSVDLKKMNGWLASILWPNQDEQEKVLRARLLEEQHGLEQQANNNNNTKNQTQRIFRIKGILSVVVPDKESADVSPHQLDDNNVDRRRYIVQAVHDLWEVYPASQELEWNDDDEERSCKVVVIGRCLQKDELEEGLRSCLIQT